MFAILCLCICVYSRKETYNYWESLLRRYFPRHFPLHVWESEEGFTISREVSSSLYLHEESVSVKKLILNLQLQEPRSVIRWSSASCTRERSDLLFFWNALSSYLHLRTYVSEKWFISFELSVVSAFTSASLQTKWFIFIEILFIGISDVSRKATSLPKPCVLANVS